MWLSNWRAKKGASDIRGYEHSDLVETVVRCTSALSEFPRIDDAVTGEILAPTLLAIAAAGCDEPHVLDFGGAAGLHYLAARQAFPKKRFRWAIIETRAMAAAATLGSDVLRFFSELADGTQWLERVDVMHSNSALQYLDKPEATLQHLIGLGAPVMLWGKWMLGERREHFAQSSRLKENGPRLVPDGLLDRQVIYDATRIVRSDFLAAHGQAGYHLAWKARDTDSYLFIRP